MARCGEALAPNGLAGPFTPVIDWSHLLVAGLMSSLIGTQLGQFHVLAKLGQGGMGEVFLAEDTTLQRRVAIKLLTAPSIDPPRLVARLRREAIALAAVSHPNVVTIHAVAEADGLPFVVMEFVEGSTLQDLLPPEGFEPARVFELALGIAAALQSAHEKGVLHRDLKPGNVMVTGDGRVKVVDFGLARMLDDDALGSTLAHTTAGRITGTLAYMAPEQLVGESLDRKSDLYSLGVLLFELATGRLPFTGTTVPWLMQQILLEPPPELASVRPDAPARLARLVAALLAKEPQRRPASAALVIEELERCRRGERIAPRPVEALSARVLATTARPVDMEVVRLLVRGRHLWNKRTEQSLRTALACFQEVIDRDPLQPGAWLGVADALNLLSNYGFAPPSDSLVRVRAAVGRAVDLEGESGDALRALALAGWQFEFAWADAEALYLRALELDPGNALTHHWYGVLLGVTERFDESLARFAQAEALDPLSLISLAARGWFTAFAGRPDEARAILSRVLSLDGAYFPAYWFDGQALDALGRYDEAVAALQRAVEIGGRTSRMLGYLGHALGLAGRTDEARQLLDELRLRAREHYTPPYFQALILAGLGEKSAALACLQTAVETGDTMVRDLAVDTPWWPLRNEPEYHRLLQRLGLRSMPGPGAA
jgi:tetratricopeptide (TPR) repeat protein/tRNA A-37 threonylcarbamoyl transferase component Bud32